VLTLKRASSVLFFRELSGLTGEGQETEKDYEENREAKIQNPDPSSASFFLLLHHISLNNDNKQDHCGRAQGRWQHQSYHP